MNFSWTGLKVSIAGARLSHLVQHDSIWDHGSMVEHVKNVYTLLKKALMCRDVSVIRRCVTTKGFPKLKTEIENLKHDGIAGTDLESIVSVSPRRNVQKESFKALVKLTQRGFSHKAKRTLFENVWCFTREGEWWMLDEIK